jgi:hypothetical protein
MAAGAIGPFAAGMDGVRIVYLHDPVAGVSYTLNEKDKTARKMPGRAMSFSYSTDNVRPAPADRVMRSEQIIIADRPGKGMVSAIRVPAPDAKNARTQSLGKRNIEGVEAEGTRTVHVIAAGEIGNERPIEIVSERWYSPELQTVVMTRHSDPRMGESTYRLENLRRGEPSASLFEVPSDYTVITEQAPNIRLRDPNR